MCILCIGLNDLITRLYLKGNYTLKALEEGWGAKDKFEVLKGRLSALEWFHG